MGYKSEFLPASVLRCMAKPDRKPLGKAGVTTEEANEKFTAKREKEVHRDIENWFRLKGIFAITSRMDRKTSQKPGIPDYIFVSKVHVMAYSIPYAIEVKVHGNKLSEAQEEVRAAMLENGWRYFVVESLDELRKLVAI